MKQILIVEDDSFLNKMLAYNLTADGYGVTSALNARTAADAIRQREFDLVLLDINLPDGNGFELCKLIKPQHPDTIVIFLTANDQESDQIRGYEVGAVDYITKPFVIGALQRKIKAMFAMLEHHKPAKDIYDDGRLFLDFSEQTASLNGKPLTLSPMEYKMLNLSRKNPREGAQQQRPARQQHRNLFCHKKQGYGDPGHGEDKLHCHPAKQPLYREVLKLHFASPPVH